MPNVTTAIRVYNVLVISNCHVEFILTVGRETLKCTKGNQANRHGGQHLWWRQFTCSFSEVTVTGLLLSVCEKWLWLRIILSRGRLYDSWISLHPTRSWPLLDGGWHRTWRRRRRNARNNNRILEVIPLSTPLVREISFWSGYLNLQLHLLDDWGSTSWAGIKCKMGI